MINSTKVKIGIDEYEIIKDSRFSGSEMGNINPGHLVINMRNIGYDNIRYTKKAYFRTLMHEIVHGIDFITSFNSENRGPDGSHEDVIEIITVYILKNINDLVADGRGLFDDFCTYVELTEYKIDRVQLLFGAIIELISDNPELMQEFAEEYK